MANPAKNPQRSSLLADLHIPLLIIGAFLLGAGGMWVIMRTSSSGDAGQRPPPNRFTSSSAATPAMPRLDTFSETSPPDVSRLAPADAARTLADWNYDQRNFPHAIEHYLQAIASGADNPDVRTDLGNCYRFTGQPQKALEEYEVAQKQNPQHENSLFNQVGLFAEDLHDNARALTRAHEFLARFPQSAKAASTRDLIARIEQQNQALP